MRLVLHSADGAVSVYSVPDIVAENLQEYCLEFCSKWLWKSEHARKYHVGDCVCYSEKDFIDYLNEWIFPDEPSELVETVCSCISEMNEIALTKKYRQCPSSFFPLLRIQV